MSLVGGAAVTSYWSGGAVGNQAAPSGTPFNINTIAADKTVLFANVAMFANSTEKRAAKYRQGGERPPCG